MLDLIVEILKIDGFVGGGLRIFWGFAQTGEKGSRIKWLFGWVAVGWADVWPIETYLDITLKSSFKNLYHPYDKNI